MIEQTAFIVASLMMATQAGAPTQIIMGDGQIDGRKIAPYEFEWRQCSFQEDKWVDGGSLTESAVAVGNLVLRVRQITEQANGVYAVGTTYLDITSLSPLRMEMDANAPDGALARHAEYTLGPDGYAGRVTLNGETQLKSGIISREMYHGGGLGLPLAALNYENAPFTFTTSLMGFNATYSTIASLAGTETWRHDGRNVEILLVDIEWIHNEIGDVYPPGPDASGGRFWIAQNPPEGFPYVPKYKTDTYAVEFIPDSCKFE